MKISDSTPFPALLGQLLSVLIFSILTASACSAAQEKILIGDPAGEDREMRNSLPALALGASADIDYIELELVATRDQNVIVFHSPDLAPDTDVTERFPDRGRSDGGYYAVDFTLDEIRQLRRKSDGFQYISTPLLGIPTLNEYLSLVRYLESRLKRDIGLAPVILYPEIHKKAQVDVSSLTLQVLQRYGFTSPDSRLLLQCFDGDELQRIKEQLMPELAIDLPLIQRIGSAVKTIDGTGSILPSYDYSWIFTRLGTRMMSSYASGIGIDSSLVFDEMGTPQNTVFLENIRTLDLKVLVADKTSTFLKASPLAADDTMFDYLYDTIGADGIITSSPIGILGFLMEREKKKANILLPLRPITGDRSPTPVGASTRSQ